MKSSRIIIIAKESRAIRELIGGLALRGYHCDLISGEEELTGDDRPDMLLIETGDRPAGFRLSNAVRGSSRSRRIPVVLLTEMETLQDMGYDPNVADFVLRPYNLDELSWRMQRLMRKSRPRGEAEEYLMVGELTIDLPRCEVAVAGKVVDLTFTEYELLKLLVRQKGRVLTREVLLNKIWGYDYFGGDRTVDVHITRLRNKIEDTTHTLIETVRNVGYRLRADAK